MNIFDKILFMLETVTSVVASVPSPLSIPAGIALQTEKILGAALAAHSASSGKTVEEIIAGLHDIPLIPETKI